MVKIADKRIYRSRKERMIGGVCGGVAEYFDIDPAIARLAAILLLFANGIGLVIYIVALIVIPERPRTENYNRSQKNDSTTIDVDAYSSDADSGENEGTEGSNGLNDNENKSSSNGTDFSEDGVDYDDEKNYGQVDYDKQDQGKKTIGLILIGVGCLFLLNTIFPYFRWQRFWPLVLVGLGVIVLLKGVNDDE